MISMPETAHEPVEIGTGTGCSRLSLPTTCKRLSTAGRILSPAHFWLFSFLRFIFLSFFYFVVWLFVFKSFLASCGILVPQPGIEPSPLALEVQSLNHQTTREDPEIYFLKRVWVVGKCLDGEGGWERLEWVRVGSGGQCLPFILGLSTATSSFPPPGYSRSFWIWSA